MYSQAKFVFVAGLVAQLILSLARDAASARVELDVGDRATRPQQPQAVVDEQGTIHVVYGVGNSVRYRWSADRGKSFSPVSELPPLGVIALGMRRGPRIAMAGHDVVVTAIGGPQGLGRDGDVLCCRSTDEGKTWQGPVRVNDVARAAREGLHGMASGKEGLVCCVWLDLRHNQTEVMASTSRDHGATWSANALVYRSPDGSVCECCHPSVAIGADQRIHVLWRNSLAGNRDMYVATSLDGGETFGEVVKLGEASWQLDACPMDGGAITCLTDNTITTVWRRDESVLMQTANTTTVISLGGGEQPWMTSTTQGPFVIWLKRRGGVALWQGPGDKSPRELAAVANDPVVAASLFGKGPVVALWEERKPDDRQAIVCQTLDDRK